MDNYTIQICDSNNKWYWVIVDEWAGDYLAASTKIENDVIWFNSKLDAEEYMTSAEISPGSEILLLQDDGNDLGIEIIKTRVVRVEAVEV